ncbi:emerin [Tiliqua scincoides]|uniref:emerin n=1 Tax=Tiliqua scincoides TaxID=71010 RepID=UPI003461DA9C
MDKYKGLTDDELLALLKKCRIRHGPIIGSTRKLYEKKIYEYEKQQQAQQHSFPAKNYAELQRGTNSTQQIVETYQNRENISHVQEGGTMPEHKVYLTDAELLARLKKYNIPHGPIVGTTRKLYEKKIYEYENKQAQRHPSPRQAEPNNNQDITQKSFKRPQSRRNLSSAREGSASKHDGNNICEKQQTQFGSPAGSMTHTVAVLRPPDLDGICFPVSGKIAGPKAQPRLAPPRSLTHFPSGAALPAAQPSPARALGVAGSTMDEYKGLTDKELIARLKKYRIPHGPIVGSTRKLYEKKIYEHETERTQRTSPGGSVSYIEPSISESYTQESFVSPWSRDNPSYGREALGSTRTYVRETYDSPRKEEYSTYENEDPSPSKSLQDYNLSYSHSLPRRERRAIYSTKDWDVNSSEDSTSSYSQYLSSAGSGTPLGAVSARQPITEPYPYNSDQKDVPTERDSSFYQSIFHRKSPVVSSLGVEPRRAIRPERQAQATERASDSSRGTKHYLPLWPQLLLFVLLAGFLAFIYFFLQGGGDDNPFVQYLQH